MSAEEVDEAEFLPSDDTEEAWTWFQQQGRWVEGFWLAFMFTESPPQAHLLQRRLREFLANNGKTQRVVRPDTADELRTALAQLGDAADDASCVWVECVRREPFWFEEGPEPWGTAWEQTLLRGNEQRERLRSRGRGIVLVMRQGLKDRARRAAPDLWSVRDRVFELAPYVPPVQPLRARDLVASLRGVAKATDQFLEAVVQVSARPGQRMKPDIRALIAKGEQSPGAVVAAIATASKTIRAADSSLFTAAATLSLAIRLNLEGRYGEALRVLGQLEGEGREAFPLFPWVAVVLAHSLVFEGRLGEAEIVSLSALSEAFPRVRPRVGPVFDHQIVLILRAIYEALGRSHELAILR